MTAISQPETGQIAAPAAYRPPPDARTVLISMNPRAGFARRHAHVEEIASAL